MADRPDEGFTQPTSGEALFLDQMSRSRMVQWCHSALTQGTGIPTFDPEDNLYRDYAVTKKWLSAKDHKVLSAGWKTGAAFLKR